MSGDHAYWSLQLNYHAVNLALTPQADTVRLTAIPRTATGDLVDGAGRVTFTAEDSTVTVDSTGLVTAHYETQGLSAITHVIATLSHQNVTLADTTAIQVVATPPAAPLHTFALQPATGLSTVCNLNVADIPFLDNCGTVFVDATNAVGDSLSNANGSTILIAYSTSDPLIAHIDRSGAISGNDTGHVRVTASTWAYGVVKRDSLEYVISWPRFNSAQIMTVATIDSTTLQYVVSLPSLSISVGGGVSWVNPYEKPIDIVFDDPSTIDKGCWLLLLCFFPSTGSGNIPPFYSDPTGTDTSALSHGIASRMFPVAGTYRYHSRLAPSVSGVILVHTDLTP